MRLICSWPPKGGQPAVLQMAASPANQLSALCIESRELDFAMRSNCRSGHVWIAAAAMFSTLRPGTA
jgi:hypothetical protein